jgi:hypothetical protein
VLANDPQSESAGVRLIEGNLAGIHVMDLIQHANDGLLLSLKTLTGSSHESFPAHAAACVNVRLAATSIADHCPPTAATNLLSCSEREAAMGSTAAAIGNAVNHRCSEREPTVNSARWISLPRSLNELQLRGEQG